MERASELDLNENMSEELNLITVNSGLKNSWHKEDIYDADGR